jgi:hypothetical protein
MDFIKFLSKQFGEPIKGGGFTNITFISDIEIIKNDLDV